MHKCESCGMPIESGTYCQYCVDDKGNLQDFDLRFERMQEWALKKGASIEDARIQTIKYMSTMPAWKNHPELLKLMN